MQPQKRRASGEALALPPAQKSREKFAHMAGLQKARDDRTDESKHACSSTGSSGTNPRLEAISPEHLDMICNPAYHAFKAGLADFHENPSNEIIDRLHTIMLIDNSQNHTQIQRLFPELYAYIGRKELYGRLCLLFADVAHLNIPVCRSMMEFGMFDRLDYGNELTYSLVTSICDCNPEAWGVFRKSHLNDKNARNSKIQLLISQHMAHDSE